MGVGRIFSKGGSVGDFPKVFSSEGEKVVKFGFYPSKLKNNIFPYNFNIQGGPRPTPSDAHGESNKLLQFTMIYKNLHLLQFMVK